MMAKNLSELRRDAELGDYRAQVQLAQRYATGDGLELDLIQAAHWYSEAATADSAEATYHLALMYALGEGVSLDIGRAFVLLKKSAKLGSDDANFALGDAYSVGSFGLQKDGVIAAKYYLDSCKYGGATRGIPSIGRLVQEGYLTTEELISLMVEFS